MELTDSPETIAKKIPKKILVVDDNTDALRTAEEILKKAKYEVIALDTPRFVFKVLKSERPDLIVLDIIMPHTDGYALCREIRKLYADKIPVLLCTAQSYEQDLIQSAYRDFGADDYILKPFKPEDFLEKIKTLIKKSSQKQK